MANQAVLVLTWPEQVECFSNLPDFLGQDHGVWKCEKVVSLIRCSLPFDFQLFLPQFLPINSRSQLKPKNPMIFSLTRCFASATSLPSSYSLALALSTASFFPREEQCTL